MRYAALFLNGRQQEVIGRLGEAMQDAVAELAFEKAAVLHDQIQSLRRVQEKQYVEAEGEDVDILAVLSEDGLVCVNLAMVRGGRHLGDRAHFPSNAAGSDPAEVLTAFLYQHYANHPAPERLYSTLR